MKKIEFFKIKKLEDQLELIIFSINKIEKELHITDKILTKLVNKNKQLDENTGNNIKSVKSTTQLANTKNINIDRH